MASSYSFFPDGDTIIKAALRRIRGYDPEDATTITTVQYDNGRETLNFLLAHWQALGLPIWCRKVTSKTLTASDGSYSIGNGGDINVNQPLAIVQAWLRDATNTTYPTDIPLNIIGQQEYYQLSSKSDVSRPVSLYYDRAYDGAANKGASSVGNIYLWPLPDTVTATNCTLYLLYQRPLLDFNASADALDMPQEWYEAVRLNLAYKLAPEYGMQASDYDRLKVEARDALELALNWDTEQVSIFFAPDSKY
jgi:hypothetical protein